MRLAFYQPDIPQNLGAALRIAACFNCAVDIIEPTGFPLTNKALKRSAMDYGPLVETQRHDSWTHFLNSDVRQSGRVVLFTTRGATPLQAMRFEQGDILLFGRESAGVPEDVHNAADARCIIPLAPGARSLNVAVTASLALYEALRQTGGLPEFSSDDLLV